MNLRRFMAPTHVQFLEVLAAHEPQKNSEHGTSNAPNNSMLDVRCFCQSGVQGRNARSKFGAFSPGAADEISAKDKSPLG